MNTSISSCKLYYYGTRYYDPKSAVFLGVDPLSDKYPGWSPFAYCLNNPIKLIDPDGNSAGRPLWIKVPKSNNYPPISTNLTGVEVIGHQTFMDKVKATLNNFIGIVTSKLTNIGAGGDVLTTSNDVGIRNNNRQGDGNNSQTNIDILSAAIGASSSNGRGLFRIPMSIRDIPQRINQFIEGLSISNDLIDNIKSQEYNSIRYNDEDTTIFETKISTEPNTGCRTQYSSPRKIKKSEYYEKINTLSD